MNFSHFHCVVAVVAVVVVVVAGAAAVGAGWLVLLHNADM